MGTSLSSWRLRWTVVGPSTRGKSTLGFLLLHARIHWLCCCGDVPEYHCCVCTAVPKNSTRDPVTTLITGETSTEERLGQNSIEMQAMERPVVITSKASRALRVVHTTLFMWVHGNLMSLTFGPNGRREKNCILVSFSDWTCGTAHGNFRFPSTVAPPPTIGRRGTYYTYICWNHVRNCCVFLRTHMHTLA